MTSRTVLNGLGCILAWAAAVRAENKAELQRVHMCCEGCAEDVGKILGKVEGVKDVKVDDEAKTAKFTATDNKVAQKAVDALAAAGFHGDTGTKEFAFNDDSG